MFLKIDTTTDSVVHAKMAWIMQQVCSKDRFLAKEIARAPLLNVYFWCYELLKNV